MYDVPFIRPTFPAPSQVSADMAEIVQSNWFTNFGPREQMFRSAIEDYIGQGVAAATFSNATVALTLALTELLAERDSGYVIVPAFTFAAGPQATLWSGHQPLLIDIDPRTLQPSIQDAREAFSLYGHHIRAILYCNTFGIGGQLAEWEALAESQAVPLIIDSAAGFGSRYDQSTLLGARGSCEVFSFHATKPLAIGEGGAVTTRDGELAERLMAASNFGFNGATGAVTMGSNGKLQEINAAIGLRQLATFEDALAARRGILQRYHDVAREAREVRFPTNDTLSSVCFASAIFPSRTVRDSVLDELRTSGIEARAYYSPAIHEQPLFENCPRIGALRVTEDIRARIVSMPVFATLPESVFERLSRALERFVR